MKKEIFPLLWIDDLLDELCEAHFLFAIDLASGYHQVWLAPGAGPKTTFSTHYGLYEYAALLLGLCNAPRVFYELMNSVLGYYIDKCSLVYLDNILMYSKSADEHEAHLC